MKDLAVLSSPQRARIATLAPIMRMIDATRPKRIGLANAAHRTGFSVKRLESLYYAWLRKGDQALINRRSLTKLQK